MDLFLPSSLASSRLFFVGIKGTGMTALAELCVSYGAVIEGSDVEEPFYTDEILSDLDIRVRDFSPDCIDATWDCVVFSAAYDKNSHPQLVKATELGIPLISYPEALGAFSRGFFSCGIAGVHGKTSTTALAGTLAHAVGLPVLALTGSAVPLWGGRATLSSSAALSSSISYMQPDSKGSGEQSSAVATAKRFFIAETCEYRRHFMHFSPSCVLLTSVEPDHLDYFEDYEDIKSAFTDYAMSLPREGLFIYCADNPGALSVAKELARMRPDMQLISYGKSQDADFCFGDVEEPGGRQDFSINGRFSFSLSVPGLHMVENATGAIALTAALALRAGLVSSYSEFLETYYDVIYKALLSFSGTRRRSEIIGEAGGILFLDDYGHHPTAIRATIKGYKQFYPGRRLIVDFMSHTYSRTKALLDDFASAFTDADIVILHKIYASAREKSGDISGKTLYQRVKALQSPVYYTEEVLDAKDLCKKILLPGDIFITMGAGNNWMLGRELYKHYATLEDKNK